MCICLFVCLHGRLSVCLAAAVCCRLAATEAGTATASDADGDKTTAASTTQSAGGTETGAAESGMDTGDGAGTHSVDI